MIQPYEIEIKCGIGDMVAKGSVSFASAITEPSVSTNRDLAIAKFKLAKADANPNQLDLYYKHSILASIGWNKNDDVFDKLESWNARHSVADKQLNLRHNELDIVGHMTDSLVFDAEGNIIPDDTDITTLPDKFDIVSEWVLYRFWENEDKRNEIEKIIAEIEQDKWFVSMECRFNQFDYAIVEPNGTHKVVARNKDTAFLSQHLRAFGGSGEFQGYRVGRLLKGFFFTGQGIVENPANERSVIFNLNDFTAFKSQGSLIIRENTMDELAQLKAQLDAALAENAAFKANKSKEDEEKMKKAECAIQEINAAKAKVEADLAAANTVLAEKDSAIAALTEEVKIVAEKLQVTEAEMTATKEEAKKSARASQLAGLVDADKVEATVAKWSSLNDEQFTDIVAMYKSQKTAATVTTTATETVVAATLEGAVVEETAALAQATASSNDRVSALASLLSSGLEYSAKASARLNK